MVVTNIGALGERIASNFLQKKGYRILEANFKKRYGEIDLVAIDNSVLVFIEVKTRTSNQFGTPLEAITPWKLKAVIRSAEYYKLTHKNLPDLMRIDAVSITLHPSGEIDDIELTKNISGF